VHRLTITLPDDLYAMPRTHAVTHGKAIGGLLRQGRMGAPPEKTHAASGSMEVRPDSGFPILEFHEEMTMEQPA